MFKNENTLSNPLLLRRKKIYSARTNYKFNGLEVRERGTENPYNLGVGRPRERVSKRDLAHETTGRKGRRETRKNKSLITAKLNPIVLGK